MNYINKMIRIADYIAETLTRSGVKHVFLLSGGGAMHLNDAIGKAPGLSYVCCHHEQSCSMAAEAYARISGKLGVINVTTGPGGINAINGVFGAYTDSIPMLVLSGQVKRETLVQTYHLEGQLRQLGDQEVNIVSMVRNITKYAVIIDDPNMIRYHLEKAIYLASAGRPGPCWIDIPVDVQATKININLLQGYDPAEDTDTWNRDKVRNQCQSVLDKIINAKRPAIMVGSGLHLSKAHKEFADFCNILSAPVTTAWTAIDAISSDDPLYCGRPGVVGDRSGNFCIQNADLVLVLGSRLPIRQVSYNWQSFASNAFKVQVDVDSAELAKPIMVTPDLAIHSDLKFFLAEMIKLLRPYAIPNYSDWLKWCKERQSLYPVVQPKHRLEYKDINPYYFIEVLFKNLINSDIIACGDASASVMTFQAANIKLGQRIFTNAGSASMGYDLPAAIGAAFAEPFKRVVCLAGEGSLMLNIQELQTVAHHRLNLKLIIFNNGGYLSIRSTQKSFFGRLVGEGPESGVSFPDFIKLSKAFSISSLRLSRSDFEEDLVKFLNQPGPGVLDVVLDRDQSFEPKLSSRQLSDGRMVTSNLEDMAPFLDRSELISNLLNYKDIMAVKTENSNL
jgi:acetolactate synthase-1/2/3 large subunit